MSLFSLTCSLFAVSFTPTLVRGLCSEKLEPTSHACALCGRWIIGYVCKSAFAHRAAGASPVRAPQPCAAGRVASPGRSGWESAWLYQPSVASGRAESSAASLRRRRNIHWRRGEGGEISTSSETRQDCREGRWVCLCASTASPALLLHWCWAGRSSARRRCLSGRFALRLRRHRRVMDLLRSPDLPLLRSTHRSCLVVCWMSRAAPSAWAFITLDKQPTASRLRCMWSCSWIWSSALLRQDLVESVFLLKKCGITVI